MRNVKTTKDSTLAQEQPYGPQSAELYQLLAKLSGQRDVVKAVEHLYGLLGPELKPEDPLTKVARKIINLNLHPTRRPMGLSALVSDYLYSESTIIVSFWAVLARDLTGADFTQADYDLAVAPLNDILKIIEATASNTPKRTLVLDLVSNGTPADQAIAAATGALLR